MTNTNHSDTAFFIKKLTHENIYLRKLTKLYAIGDFDGDGKKDTVYQHNFSKLHHTEIDSSADPFQNELDIVSKWFYDQQSDVFLTINKRHQDTLHLGTAQGLYCLLNVGDNNLDGKDEIAFVTDYCDFSQLNSCGVYSLCGGKWKQLFNFQIHEDAFSFTSDSMPTFTNIRGYLEKKDGKWFYLDYYRNFIEGDLKVEKNVKAKTS